MRDKNILKNYQKEINLQTKIKPNKKKKRKTKHKKKQMEEYLCGNY